MKKITMLMLSLCVAFLVGCGPEAKPTMGPEPTATSTTDEIEQAVESGEIDPATYGKE